MRRGFLGCVALVLLGGCGVEVEAVLKSYLRGFKTMVDDYPCSPIDCYMSGDHHVQSPLARYSEIVRGSVLTEVGDVGAELLLAYQEAAFDHCSIPSNAKLERLNRVEAAVLGAEDACVFCSSFDYARSCEGVEAWAEGEVTDNFGGFVNTLADQPSKCSSEAENIDP